MKKLHVLMQGGLGNQLFTYFAAADYAFKYHRQLILHIDELKFGYSKRDFLLQDLNLPYPYVVSNLNKSNKKIIHIILMIIQKFFFAINHNLAYHSLSSGYDSSLLLKPNLRLLKGYFQTYIHFDNIKKIYPDFEIGLKHKSDRYLSIYNEIMKHYPIVVHVRRGDYKKLVDIYGLLSESYYLKALNNAKATDNSKIWIVSDCLEDIKLHFKNIQNDFQIYEIDNLKDSEILTLMSSAKCLIMSNSSFSWWAGKLGNDSKTVFYPDPWYPKMEIPIFHKPPKWISQTALWD